MNDYELTVVSAEDAEKVWGYTGTVLRKKRGIINKSARYRLNASGVKSLVVCAPFLSKKEAVEYFTDKGFCILACEDKGKSLHKFDVVVYFNIGTKAYLKELCMVHSTTVYIHIDLMDAFSDLAMLNSEMLENKHVFSDMHVDWLPSSMSHVTVYDVPVTRVDELLSMPEVSMEGMSLGGLRKFVCGFKTLSYAEV